MENFNATDFSAAFVKVRIKGVPDSEPCFVGTFDVSEKVYVELYDEYTPHTFGNFTIKELESDPALEVEVKFKNFKWSDF